MLTAALLTVCQAPPAAASAWRPQTGFWNYHLAAVEATGLRHVSRAQLVAISGLKPGSYVKPADVEVARGRLLQSGLFESVGYRFEGTGYQLTLVWTVQEPSWDIPVLFDNFVGFTDDQLKQAVARELPPFDGSTPGLPATLNRITRALERFARDAKEPGTIDYVLIDDPTSGTRRYVFRIHRASGEMPICALSFQGASDAFRQELVVTARPLQNTNYSKDFVMRFADQNLVPVYRLQGYLRARVQSVTAEREGVSEGGCKGGAAVVITLDEGAPYTWKAPTWRNNTVFQAAELDAFLGIEAGETADGAKIDQGLQTVADAYRRKGHIGIVVFPKPDFDDVKHVVAYTIQVSEGPQYRMGGLRIIGLAPEAADRVKAGWLLAEGAVFDGIYPSEFVKELKARESHTLAGVKEIKTELKPNSATHTVDVVITFTGATDV